MAWGSNQGMNSIAPFMKKRQPVLVPPYMSYEPNDLARFQLTGEATFRFGIAKASNPKPVSFMLSLNGAYNDYSSAHDGLLWIVMDESELIGAFQFNEFSDLPADLVAPNQKGNHDGKLATGEVWDMGNQLTLALSAARIGTYAKVLSTGAYYYFNRRNHDASFPDQTWVKVKIALPDEPTSGFIGGEECDIYAVTERIDALPINLPDGYKSGYRFGLCFGGNARHENEWDASFFIDAPLTNSLFERTELNSRVAGERAIYEDEFVPISQIEAGLGIQIRYRNELGQVGGFPQYAPDVAKAFNLVIDTNEYLWALSDRLHFTTVKPDDYIIIRTAGAARFVVEQGDDSALIDVPLRISKNGSAVGADDTVEIDFQNPAAEIPEDATEPVYFEVSNDGAAAWSETPETEHGDHLPRTVKGVKGFVRKSSPNIAENSVQVNTVPTKELNFDDTSAPPPGEAVVNWDISEESDASIRIKGSVTLDEPIKPAMRCQWSAQLPNEVPNPALETAICSRLDCRRAQVVSPFGVRYGNLDPYGHEHIVNKGPGGFNLVHGPPASNTPNLNGGALEVAITGRFMISVDMFGMHAPEFLEKASLQNRYIEHQLHVLKFDDSVGTWMWYGHLGSYTFHQRTWPVGSIPPDQESLPWAIQGWLLIQLNSGDKVTFYRSARSFPSAYLSMNDNNARVFFVRNMSFNIAWHDTGTENEIDGSPQYPVGINTGATANPGLWDWPINGEPAKFF